MPKNSIDEIIKDALPLAGNLPAGCIPPPGADTGSHRSARREDHPPGAHRAVTRRSAMGAFNYNNGAAHAGEMNPMRIG